MRKSNRYMATMILLIVTAGFLISSLFYDTFTGRLLAALFGASMIGGIADWFGITALFRKPLGIPFKTEIIQNSRERITESIVLSVEQELLTKEALISKLDQLDIADKLIYYMDEQGGKKDLTALAKEIVADMAKSIDQEKTGEYLDKVFTESVDNFRAYPLFLNAAEWFVQNWDNEKVISELVDNLKDFILDKKVANLAGDAINNVFCELKQLSDNETAGKRLFFKLIFTVTGFTDVSSIQLASKLQLAALEYLNHIKHPESSQRQALKGWIENIAHDLKNDPSLKEKVERISLDLLNKAKIGQMLTGYLFPYLKNPEQSQMLDQYVETIIDKLIENFKSSPADQDKLNAYIKNALTQVINEYHSKIGELVRDKLNSFSNKMLVELIEDKAGNDLQIIRINGSVVGGITGMLIFLMTFWIK